MIAKFRRTGNGWMVGLMANPADGRLKFAILAVALVVAAGSPDGAKALCTTAIDLPLLALQQKIDVDPNASLIEVKRLLGLQKGVADVRRTAWLYAIAAQSYSALELNEEERAAATAGLALPLAAADPARLELLIQRADSLSEPAEIDAAIIAIDRARALQPAGSVANVCAQSALGLLEHVRDRPALAATRLVSAYRMALPTAMAGQRAAIASNFSAVLSRAGDIDEALALNAEEIAWTTANGMTYALANAQFFRGQMLGSKRDWNGALASYGAAGAGSRRLGDVQGAAYAEMGICEADLELGADARALKHCLAAARTFDVGAAKTRKRTQWLIARILIEQGKPRQAVSLLDAVLGPQTVASSSTMLTEAFAARAAAQADLGNFKAAYRDLAEHRRRALEAEQGARGRQAAVTRARFAVDRLALRNGLLAEQLRSERRSQEIQARWLALAVFSAVLLTILAVYVGVTGRLYRRNLQKLAGDDVLTGLPNRRRITDIATAALERASAEKYPLTFALLDIDHFKTFNDRFGHDAGDKVLQNFSALAQDTVGCPDLVGRWGGEEFLVIFPNATPAQAGEVLDRLRSEASRLDLAEVAKRGVQFSAGLTAADAHLSLAEIVAAADRALYAAKATGRDCTVVAGTALAPIEPFWAYANEMDILRV